MLTRRDHSLGWLLSVLQKEQSDIEELRETLRRALSRLNALDASRADEKARAIMYLAMFILHRRSPEERQNLITFIDEQTPDMEVETMAQTMAEVLIEQGIQQGIQRGIQQGIEQGIERGKVEGIEQGAKETTIESILLVLDTRLQANTAQMLKPTLEAIDDLPRLKQLLREAAQTETLDAFITALKTNGAVNP